MSRRSLYSKGTVYAFTAWISFGTWGLNNNKKIQENCNLLNKYTPKTIKFINKKGQAAEKRIKNEWMLERDKLSSSFMSDIVYIGYYLYSVIFIYCFVFYTILINYMDCSIGQRNEIRTIDQSNYPGYIKCIFIKTRKVVSGA